MRGEIRWDTKLKWSFHCLRHSGAVDLRTNGAMLEDIMVRGRWRSKSVAKHYAEVNRQKRGRVMDEAARKHEANRGKRTPAYTQLVDM